MTATQTQTETRIVTPEIVTEVPKPTKAVARPMRLISEDGKINRELLTPEVVKKCREITANLSPNDMMCVSNYGVQVIGHINDSSKNPLLNTKSTGNTEMDNVMQEISEYIVKVDMEDLAKPNALVQFLSHFPIIRDHLPTVENKIKAYQTLENKVSLIKENILSIESRTILQNSQLQMMYDDTQHYIKQIEDLIVAAQVAYEDASAELQRLVQEGADPMEIRKYQGFIKRLGKKIEDLFSVRAISKIQQGQIYVTQDTNTNLMDATRTLYDITMTALGKQLAILAAQKDQKKSIDFVNKVRDMNSKAIRASADAAYNNTVEMASFNSQSAIDFDSVEYATQKLKDSLVKAHEIEQTYLKERSKRIEAYAKLEGEMNQLNSKLIDIKTNADSSVSGISLLEENK